MPFFAPRQPHRAQSGTASALCPHADRWTHADIAESLDMPIGTLLHDADGLYCPACDYRPERSGTPDQAASPSN